jgi:hypothetical protein
VCGILIPSAGRCPYVTKMLRSSTEVHRQFSFISDVSLLQNWRHYFIYRPMGEIGPGEASVPLLISFLAVISFVFEGIRCSSVALRTRLES